MGKKIKKTKVPKMKERMFNLEVYVDLLVERIERLENETKRHSECISNTVVDVRNLELKSGRTEDTANTARETLGTIAEDFSEALKRIDRLEDNVSALAIEAKCLEEKNAITDLLVSTDFKGNVKHKRLISKMKKEIKEALKCSSFEDLKREILNGDRSVDDLYDYKRIMMKHEEEQKIVDYVNKEGE
jgi:uncharacterized protein (UPF0335 family)